MSEEVVKVGEEFLILKKTQTANRLVVGLAGRKGSGKTTLAWGLAPYLDGIVAPLASSLKGSAYYALNALSFRPQWTSESRRYLQDVGMRGRILDEDLWIKVWEACFRKFKSVIIPDVRFENEVNFIHSQGGVVIYLDYVRAEYDEHPSEQLSPDKCDFVVTVTDENRSSVLPQVLTFLRSKFGDAVKSFPQPYLYIGSNIHGNADYVAEFENIAKLAAENGFKPLTPLDATDPSEWEHLVTTLPFTQASRQLVVADILLIARSHAAFFYITKPSLGVGMEIAFASLNERPIVVVTPDLSLYYHPWLQAFSSKVFWGDYKSPRPWHYLESIFAIKSLANR